MLKNVTATLLASALILSTVSANAALNGYLTMTGQKSGQVKGGVTQKGHEGAIMVIATSHSVVSPRDPRSGLPTGQRMHKPFVITKEVDRSSPILYSMLATNENIPSLELKFYAPSVMGSTGTGTEQLVLTVKLTNANIASIDFHQPNTQNAEAVRLPLTEEISFTYQKIEWSSPEGTKAQDSWTASGA